MVTPFRLLGTESHVSMGMKHIHCPRFAEYILSPGNTPHRPQRTHRGDCMPQEAWSKCFQVDLAALAGGRLIGLHVWCIGTAEITKPLSTQTSLPFSTPLRSYTLRAVTHSKLLSYPHILAICSVCSCLEGLSLRIGKSALHKGGSF